MKNFNIERYKIFHDTKNRTIIAESSFAGKKVRGVAKCSPEDKYDAHKGAQLAAARCNEKILKKRVKRAAEKVFEASNELADAQRRYQDMIEYYVNATQALYNASEDVNELIKKL